MPLCPINIPLSNGAQMPALGFGTWQATDDSGLDAALDKALETGYRHIDTAAIYGVEKIVGNVLKRWLDSGRIRREELFIVTKLPGSGNRESSVEKYIKKSLADLQLDYVDLYLIHNPVGFLDEESDKGLNEKPVLDKSTDIIGVWRGMEAQVDAGRAKAIGLSNFNEEQIQRILDAARIKPANLQIELHVYFQQRPLVEFCRKNNISVVAYAPLGSKGMNDLLKNFDAKYKLPDLLQNEVVLSVAKKHKKTPAQVLIRHILQRGISTIPKSATPERVVSNFQVFDFELDKADVEALDKLDQGPKGRGFDFVAFGFHEHPEYAFKDELIRTAGKC